VSLGVSVVATIKNERDSIKPFLASLLAQSRPPEEIMVVDGGSRDGTLEAVREVGAHNGTIRLHVYPGSTIAQGRNRGIERAAGPIIAVADAGTVLAPGWLQELVRPLDSDRDVAVSAGFYQPGGRSWFERCLSTVITPQLPEIDPERFLPSSRSVAFRKSWWNRVGGYPEWLRHCEDLVFDLDLKRAGARFAFAPDARVTWHARRSLPAFARQYFLYARGDGHARLWPQRHLVRYTSYAVGAALLAAGHRRPAALGPLVFGGSIYLGKFARRLRRMPPDDRRLSRAAAYALMPLIVVTGDLAKMAGYPVGLLERHRRRGGHRGP
jgi:glycosyltransferase involved in cell wall biosynthesis